MSLRKPWGEEEHKKAIRAFRRVYPDWSIVSNQPSCPRCGKANFCKKHHFAFEKWLGSVAGVPLLALRDPRLKVEFKTGILKGCCPPEPMFDPLCCEGEKC